MADMKNSFTKDTYPRTHGETIRDMRSALEERKEYLRDWRQDHDQQHEEGTANPIECMLLASAELSTAAMETITSDWENSLNQ